MDHPHRCLADAGVGESFTAVMSARWRIEPLSATTVGELKQKIAAEGRNPLLERAKSRDGKIVIDLLRRDDSEFLFFFARLALALP